MTTDERGDPVIRRYRIHDAITLEPTSRIVELDLDDPRLTAVTVLDGELGGRMGPAHSIDIGREHEAARAAAEDAGVFASGEAPPRRRQAYPVGRERERMPVGGSERGWRAGATQVGPPTEPPARFQSRTRR